MYSGTHALFLHAYRHLCTLELLYYRPSACMTMCYIHCCSSGFKLFYPEDPLWIVRGEGQYLYNQQGRKYLDCVNNINHGMCVHTYLCVVCCMKVLFHCLKM